MGEAGRALSLGTPDTAAAPSERRTLLLLQENRREGGRPRGHRLLLGNKTVIKQKHIEGTTHAYDIFSPKQLKFGSGGSNGLTGRKSGSDS